MNLAGILEAGRQDFLEATSGISPEQAAAKPSRQSWSVLECIEHVVILEERYLGWIAEGKPVSSERNPEKELRLFSIIRNRLTRVETPDVLWPHGRFKTLPVALAAFNEVRNRSVRVVEEQGENLYSVGATHPYFGEVNGAELIQLIDGHARRHADQIRDTSEENKRRSETEGQRDHRNRTAPKN